jgi:hypothetical protein
MQPMEIVRAVLIYVLVALIAGGIAYLGNWMGRKIGRKKLTVLGMRPKHTSNFITAVTGSLIAITTLSVFVAFSEEGRAVLFSIRSLKVQLEDLRQQVEDARRNRIVWGANQPIVLGVLQPGLEAPVQKERILNGLSYANTLTVQRYNEIAKENGDPPVSPDTQVVTWSEERVDEIANYMVTNSKVEGIRFSAARNTVYKDEMPVDMNILPVKRIFREGEIVASEDMRPDSPELLLQWYAFVNKVRDAAKQRGMIELNDSLGGLKPEDFDQVVQEMKRLRGPGRLVAVASHDLYQTSRLDIRIEVRPRGEVLPKAESIVGGR